MRRRRTSTHISKLIVTRGTEPSLEGPIAHPDELVPPETPEPPPDPPRSR
jgi:hypothetical protein